MTRQRATDDNRKSRTRAEELRFLIADEIVRGNMVPGIALEEAELARRFGVSRTPVREALRLLAASGLIDLRPHRGAVVARPNATQISHMFEAMADLESLCAGHAAERMTVSERCELEAVHETLRIVTKMGDVQRYHEINERFHAILYAGAHNNYLAEITLASRTRVQPFRRAQFRNVGRMAKSYAEHDRIVEAVLRGDRLLAAHEMYTHIVTVGLEYEHYSNTLPRQGATVVAAR